MFNNDITQTYNQGDATLEILIMLAGAFLLGLLLSWLISKLIYNSKKISTADQRNEDAVTFADLNEDQASVTSFVNSKHTVRSIEKDYQAEILANPYTRPKIDDLTKITGISTSLENQLRDHGIKSFTDLRDSDRQTLVKSLKFSKDDLIAKETQFWPHQASLAAKGDWTKLSEYQSFLKRTSDKTTSLQQDQLSQAHDDLTKIEGIGPKIEEILNTKSIVSYKDLMTSDRDTLKSYLDEEGTRFEKNEPETWPLQAGMAERGEWEELKIYQEFMDDDSSFFTNEKDDTTTTTKIPDHASTDTIDTIDSGSNVTKNLSSIDSYTSSKKSTTSSENSEIKDDLKKIDGIGPKIQEILNNKGIHTYRSLKKSDRDTLKSYLDEAGTQFKLHEPDTWPRQAGYAEKGKWRELEEYQDFMQGVRQASLEESESEPKLKTSSPHGIIAQNNNVDQRPSSSDSTVETITDDLKKIEGIGPKIEELLHKAGINTFEKLKNCNSATIKDLLDTAGPQFRMHNPDTWPHQAKMAFNGEWKQLEEYQDFLLGGRE